MFFWAIISIAGVVIAFFIIGALFMFIAKFIHAFFGVGWMLAFIFGSAFFGFVFIVGRGNPRRGAGTGQYSGSGGYSNGGHSENAPYQGDRSMVGGVVGGSITNPVGGRAGQ